jgi:hypothetical protein
MARPAPTLTVGGIDPNSHKIAIVETRKSNKNKPFIHTIEMGTGDYEDRVSLAFDFTFDFVMSVRERDGFPPRLFLEAPVMGVGGPGATIPQAFVSGGIMAAAVQGGAVISLVNNQSWKKRVCGNGGFNKFAVSRWVEEAWPALYGKAPIITTQAQGKELQGRADQDILDAGCLNIYGWRHVEMVERMWRRRNG